MIEFLFDTSHIQVNYPLYVGILFGLSIQFFLVCGDQFRSIQTLHSPSKLDMKIPCPVMQKNGQYYHNRQFIWLITSVRNKVIPKDEEADSIFTSIYFK